MRAVCWNQLPGVWHSVLLATSGGHGCSSRPSSAWYGSQRKCYAARGTAVLSLLACRPISSVIGQDGWTVAMNAGIFLHCLIAYQVNANVWCSLLLHVTVPK